ncbi:MAG: heme d1 biosynthesis radical SAM protein NirJ, partial [Alphaproteobacteria bacterium]
MFRLTKFLQEIDTPTAVRPRRDPPGPVVIWNLIRRCNLTCKHCYAISANKDFPGELSLEQVIKVLDDLHSFKVPALILSGGEPLLRPDLFVISRLAKTMRFYVGLSTNGTLIDEHMRDDIAGIGYDYVGISIDGLADTHNEFRRMDGAFDKSMRGIRLCRDAGLKVGLRFTMTQDNAHELPAMLDMIDAEGIDRFYFSHLNYAGRGNHNRKDDAVHAMTRNAMDLLFARTLVDIRRGKPKEVVTGNNDADGVYLLHWIVRNYPEHTAHIHEKLVQWGGNASGLNVANIDNVGEVHPDTMWWHHGLGNVKDRPFSEIWTDTSDPLMAGMKSRPRPLKGRCGACAHVDICNGNSRVRAEQVTGDAWAEDPGCYLT